MVLIQQAEDRLVPNSFVISRCNERRFLLWCDARVRIEVKIQVVYDAEAELVDFLLRREGLQLMEDLTHSGVF